MGWDHVQAVLDSALPEELKPIAVIFGHHANNKTNMTYPSVETLVRGLSGVVLQRNEKREIIQDKNGPRLGTRLRLIDRRVVQRKVRLLEQLGILSRVEGSPTTGGRGKSITYYFRIEALQLLDAVVEAARLTSQAVEENSDSGIAVCGETNDAAESAIQTATQDAENRDTDPKEPRFVNRTNKNTVVIEEGISTTGASRRESVQTLESPDQIFHRASQQLVSAYPGWSDVRIADELELALSHAVTRNLFSRTQIESRVRELRGYPAAPANAGDSRHLIGRTA